MEPTVLKVEGMSCQHCVASVTKALEGVPGVERAEVDLASRTAKVWGPAAKADLVAAVDRAGFTAG